MVTGTELRACAQVPNSSGVRRYARGRLRRRVFDSLLVSEEFLGRRSPPPPRRTRTRRRLRAHTNTHHVYQLTRTDTAVTRATAKAKTPSLRTVDQHCRNGGVLKQHLRLSVYVHHAASVRVPILYPSRPLGTCMGFLEFPVQSVFVA